MTYVLYSVVGHVSSSGSLAGVFSALPFGPPDRRLVVAGPTSPALSSPYYGFFGGQTHPEFGVLYFGDRYLAPGLGRWLSPDPPGVQQLGAFVGPNAYALARGSPAVFGELGGLLPLRFGSATGPEDVAATGPAPDPGPDPATADVAAAAFELYWALEIGHEEVQFFQWEWTGGRYWDLSFTATPEEVENVVGAVSEQYRRMYEAYDSPARLAFYSGGRPRTDGGTVALGEAVSLRQPRLAAALALDVARAAVGDPYAPVTGREEFRAWTASPLDRQPGDLSTEVHEAEHMYGVVELVNRYIVELVELGVGPGQTLPKEQQAPLVIEGAGILELFMHGTPGNVIDERTRGLDPDFQFPVVPLRPSDLPEGWREFLSPGGAAGD